MTTRTQSATLDCELDNQDRKSNKVQIAWEPETVLMVNSVCHLPGPMDAQIADVRPVLGVSEGVYGRDWHLKQ